MAPLSKAENRPISLASDLIVASIIEQDHERYLAATFIEMSRQEIGIKLKGSDQVTDSRVREKTTRSLEKLAFESDSQT